MELVQEEDKMELLPLLHILTLILHRLLKYLIKAYKICYPLNRLKKESLIN